LFHLFEARCLLLQTDVFLHVNFVKVKRQCLEKIDLGPLFFYGR